jgi:acetoin utilization deacetylase AcuC-like enzyme
MLPFKIVYHERYDLNLGPHVFPSQKFRLIYEMLLRENIATKNDFLIPNPGSDEDILRVHTADWVRKLKTGTLTASDVMKLEVPYSPELVEAVWLAAGGTILAGQSGSVRISAADFITLIRATVKDSARFMMWPLRFENCRRTAR